MARFLETIAREYKQLRKEIPPLTKGYLFARHLVKDVRARKRLILSNQDSQNDPLSDLGLIAQLKECEFALNDMYNKDATAYSVGVGMYMAFHKKDEGLVKKMYNYLNQKANPDDFKAYDKEVWDEE